MNQEVMHELPYYAVIFTSRKKMESQDYNLMAERMQKLSSERAGFIGIQSSRNENGFGITVSYWKTLGDIANWKADLEHREAQQKGKAIWYSGYEIRICKVERQYCFGHL